MKQDQTTPEEVESPKEQIPGGSTGKDGDRPKWLPRPLTLAFALGTLLLSVALAVFLLTAERPTSGTLAGGSAGTAAIPVGGPFELVDQTGKTVTQADFRGKYMLIYFGFTYCPDVCPTALQVMTSALDQLGDRASQVQPVFISIDPERDTPENMAAYVSHFHERMVGLTGTPAQVRKAADAYRVFYKKVQESGGSDYVMDHTSVVYLMGPEGGFAGHFNHTTSPEKMAEGIARVIEKNGS